MNKKHIVWSFPSDHGTHRVELCSWHNSGRTKIVIDGSVVYKKPFNVLRQNKTYAFTVDGDQLEIESNDRLPYLDTCENQMLRYDCFVNGLSLNFGTGKKSEEERLMDQTRQKKLAWECTHSKGLPNYLLKRFLCDLVLLIIPISAFALILRLLDKNVTPFFILSAAMLLMLQISNLLEWRGNCKKHGKHKTDHHP